MTKLVKIASLFNNFIVSDQKKYLRTMAREVADIKSENRDLRRLLHRRQSVADFNNIVSESRNSVFEKHVSLPLKTIHDFKHFEDELLKVEVRSNLVIVI